VENCLPIKLPRNCLFLTKEHIIIAGSLSFLILLYMKRMIVFIFMCAFALLFLLSYLYEPDSDGYGKIMNRVGQAGLALCILLFFIFPGKKSIPKSNEGGGSQY
jgi:hypothetical protein